MRQNALNSSTDDSEEDEPRPRGNTPSRSGFSGWGSDAGSSVKPGIRGGKDDGKDEKKSASTAP